MGLTRRAGTVFLRATSMNDVEPWRRGRARVWWPRPRLVLQFSRRAVYQHAHGTRVRPRTPPAPQRRRRGKPRLHHADIPAGRLDSGGGPRAAGFPARPDPLTSWAFFFRFSGNGFSLVRWLPASLGGCPVAFCFLPAVRKLQWRQRCSAPVDHHCSFGD